MQLSSDSSKKFSPASDQQDSFFDTRLIEEVEDYAIIFLNTAGIIKSWNAGAEKIKGYQSNEILGKHFSIFYRPEDQAINLPDKLIQLAANEGKATHEGWRVRKDGSTFWGSITITALHNEAGSLLGFSKVTKDLTERKSNEDRLEGLAEKLRVSNEALQKSEERYHKMIAEVQDYAIILLDTGGTILNWNAGAEQIKGYAASEIIGRNFRIFYRQEDRENKLPEKLINLALSSGKAQHEGWRVRKDGSTFWGNIVITALHNDDGSLIGFSKVTRDLTERKKTEDKMQEYLAELQSQNLQLEQFSYVASHDLQEPLRKIRTFISLVEINLQDPEFVKKYLDKISATAERMTEQIQGILQYSRIAKGFDKKDVVDVNEIVAGVILDFELLIQEKNAVVRFDQLHKVKGVEVQIRQLMINLIGNALKFCKQTPLIIIQSRIVDSSQMQKVQDQSEEKKFIEISVADNGIGFDQQYEQQIFLLFHRLYSKHEFPGTGIGLTICKKIMENHDGFIQANGGLGKGATFYLYFPVEEAE